MATLTIRNFSTIPSNRRCANAPPAMACPWRKRRGCFCATGLSGSAEVKESLWDRVSRLTREIRDRRFGNPRAYRTGWGT